MYYLVIGELQGSCLPHFEWVIKADTKEDAILDAQKDMLEDDVILEVKELTIEECIERENKNIESEIARYYMCKHYNFDNVPIRHTRKIAEQFNSSRENYYEAIKEVVKSIWLLRRLDRLTYVDNMMVKDLREGLDSLVNAKTEEELTDVFQSLTEKYGDKREEPEIKESIAINNSESYMATREKSKK